MIEITGGEVFQSKHDVFADNIETYHLTLDDFTWTRVTDNRHWRKFLIMCAPNMHDEYSYEWFTGSILKQLGYPCELDVNKVTDDESDLSDPVHVLYVDEVRVTCSDHYRDIRVAIQGKLEPAVVEELIRKITSLARETQRMVTRVIEY